MTGHPEPTSTVATCHRAVTRLLVGPPDDARQDVDHRPPSSPSAECPVRTGARGLAHPPVPPTTHSSRGLPSDDIVAAATKCRYGCVEKAAKSTFGVTVMCASVALVDAYAAGRNEVIADRRFRNDRAGNGRGSYDPGQWGRRLTNWSVRVTRRCGRVSGLRRRSATGPCWSRPRLARHCSVWGWPAGGPATPTRRCAYGSGRTPCSEGGPILGGLSSARSTCASRSV